MENKTENVVIVGAGIAGLTAAIYCARANLSPLVITGKEEGGERLLQVVNLEEVIAVPTGKAFA